MFHEFFRWLQDDLGANPETGAASWSQQLLGSLNIWPLLEGTHVLTLMAFAGTIWIVDLRMMGVAFRNTSFSKLNDKVLPYTATAFAVMIITGIVLFLAKPMVYYHSLWFRLKIVFLIVAAINIFWFHHRIQKGQAEWDENPSPPSAVRMSGLISMISWILVIAFGRLIAYNWLDCGKPLPGWVNVIAECASWPGGIVTDDSSEPSAPAEETEPALEPSPPPAQGADAQQPGGQEQ